MNILFIQGKYPNIGGVEIVSTILANYFIKNNHNVFFVSFEQPIQEITPKLDPSILLYKLSYPVLSYNNLNYLIRIIKENKIDFILNQWCLPFKVTLLLKAAIRNSATKIISVHHNIPNSNTYIETYNNKIHLSNSNYKLIINKFLLNIATLVTIVNLKLVYKYSDKYILLSDSFHNIFKSFINLNNSNKLLTISNPLTIEDSNSYNKDLNKSKSLLYVGRLEYNQKKVIRILHLWKELEIKYPDWNLIIVGDGPEKESLIKYTESNNLQRVEFKGFKNPIEYYRKCPIILMTSDYEGLPLTLIEAISFGTIPIVYESFTSIHDIIKNGENGIIIPKSTMGFNKQLMIEEISRLIEDDQLKKRLSYNAYISSRKYDINHIYKQWNILFNSYLS